MEKEEEDITLLKKEHKEQKEIRDKNINNSEFNKKMLF